MPFDFESPESVTRKIESLDAAFEALARSYAMDGSVQAETRRFRTWRDKVRSSLTGVFFPSTIASEYEQWQHRYKLAFRNAQKTHPTVETTAPLPSAIIAPRPPTSPWVYAIVTGSVAAGLIAIASMRK